jgi:hypothetical protein
MTLEDIIKRADQQIREREEWQQQRPNGDRRSGNDRRATVRDTPDRRCGEDRRASRRK